MVQEVLRILFYLLIAVPFLYMALDVFFDFFKRGYRFYRVYAHPVFTQHLTSIFK